MFIWGVILPPQNIFRSAIFLCCFVFSASFLKTVSLASRKSVRVITFVPLNRQQITLFEVFHPLEAKLWQVIKKNAFEL